MRVSVRRPRSCHPTHRNAARPRGALVQVTENVSQRAAGTEGRLSQPLTGVDTCSVISDPN